MHAGQGSEGPAASGDPKQNTDCAFANRIFRPRFLLPNKPELLSAGVVGLLCWGGGVAGFLCLCPESSTRLNTVSAQGAGLRQMQALGWPASGTGWGSGGIMMPGRNQLSPCWPRSQVSCTERPVTPPAALRGGCLFTLDGIQTPALQLGRVLL